MVLYNVHAHEIRSQVQPNLCVLSLVFSFTDLISTQYDTMRLMSLCKRSLPTPPIYNIACSYAIADPTVPIGLSTSSIKPSITLFLAGSLATLGPAR